MNPKRLIFILLGCVCVSFGVLGVVVPGLPTTPFLLLASWLFYRSSPQLRAWLLASWLGRYIRDYERNRGITFRKKIYIILLMLGMCSLSIFVFIQSFWPRIVVAIAALIGSIVVFFVVPTTKK